MEHAMFIQVDIEWQMIDDWEDRYVVKAQSGENVYEGLKAADEKWHFGWRFAH